MAASPFSKWHRAPDSGAGCTTSSDNIGDFSRRVRLQLITREGNITKLGILMKALEDFDSPALSNFSISEKETGECTVKDSHRYDLDQLSDDGSVNVSTRCKAGERSVPVYPLSGYSCSDIAVPSFENNEVNLSSTDMLPVQNHNTKRALPPMSPRALNSNENMLVKKPRHRRSLKDGLERKYKCQQDRCEKIYASVNALKQHVKIKHTNRQSTNYGDQPGSVAESRKIAKNTSKSTHKVSGFENDFNHVGMTAGEPTSNTPSSASLKDGNL
eukprot:CFRG0232T1